MNNIVVKDNFLSDLDKDEIEKLLTSNYFAWFLTEERDKTVPLKSITDLKKSGFKNTYLIKESPQFCHMFYDNITDTKSEYYRLIDELLKKLNLNNKIIRAKSNYLSQNNSFKKENFHTPHIDTNTKHIVVLYYVIDSDGDTLFFNKEGDIINKVSPKKGRCVIFDGNILHASQNPIKSKDRIVINIDLKNEED